ncbi:MAG: hypothetical protein LBP21_06220 [Synergistaceae bacterium]|jgi:hypothetical protein|nr:hypothetical protein [Synergistaceae bacterium]
MRKELVDIEVPEILPPSDDGVFKTLLTHPNAKRCLVDIIASNIGLPVKDVTVRNNELPIRVPHARTWKLLCEMPACTLPKLPAVTPFNFSWEIG